jgi:hypothetical protein
MYLFHITTLDNISKILHTGKILSNKATGIIEYGNGIYTKPNPYIFMNTTDKLYDKQVYTAGVIIYIKSDILKNTTFWLNRTHTPYVENAHKYEKGYKYYNIVLRNLYKQSMFKIRKHKFEIYQQVAIKKSIKIDSLVVGIEFYGQNPSVELLEYIKQTYPYIEIKITKYRLNTFNYSKFLKK